MLFMDMFVRVYSYKVDGKDTHCGCDTHRSFRAVGCSALRGLEIRDRTAVRLSFPETAPPQPLCVRDYRS